MKVRPDRIQALAAAVALICLALGTNASRAATEIRASVSQTQITLADTIEYRLEVTGDAAAAGGLQPQLPDFNASGFLVVSGPSSEQRISIINGTQAAPSLTFRWMLQPTREGPLEIGPTRLVTGAGMVIQSNSVRVTVSKTAASLPGAPPSPDPAGEGIYWARTGNPAIDRQLQGRLFLRPTIDKTDAFVGEQITLRYELYQSPELGDLRYSIEDRSNPYPGFMVEVLYRPTQHLQFRQERAGERTFQVAPIEVVALFPTKTGATSIPALRMTSEIPVRADPLKRRRPTSFFDDFFLDDPFFRETVRATLVARPIGVRVLPLPTEGKPADFSGTVGEYQMAASFDRNEVQQYDLVNLKVQFTGKGQAAAISPPRLPAVPGLERFKEQSSNQPPQAGGATEGAKTFEFFLRPTEAGEIKFPGIEYALFNPSRKQYERLQTQPLTLRVLPAPKPEKPVVQVYSPPPTAAPGEQPSSVVEINRDIEYIQTTGFLRHGMTAAPLCDSTAFLSFQLVPVALLAVSYTIRRRREKIQSDVAWARRRSARSVASKRLRGARKLLAGPNADRFFEELSRALRQFVADYGNESAAGLTAERIAGLLSDRRVEAQDVSEMVALLDLCESARYSSSRPDVADMQRAFDRASELVDRLARNLR